MESIDPPGARELGPAPGPSSRNVVELYERRAADWDRERGRSLFERSWLYRFTSDLPVAASILDLGCGSGEPIAQYLIRGGFNLVGVDTSATLIAMCEGRFPMACWHVADMRSFEAESRFHGILAWDSFFHLSHDDQRKMFPRFARQALPGAKLLFTSGPADGEAIGSWHGEPLYHASLAPDEYRYLLQVNGFSVVKHVAQDPKCGGHTVWLASFENGPGSSAHPA